MGYVSFYGIYSFQYGILGEDITEKLENAAESHLDKLDRMFFERLSDLEILSSSPVFQSKGKNNTTLIQKELVNFIRKYPQYTSVSYFDTDRMFIASTGMARRIFKRHPFTEYWPAIYEGRDHIVNISRSSSLQEPTLHFANRVLDRKGNTLGVLVARVPVKELYGLMGDEKNVVRDTVKYKMDVLDRDGKILYSNHNRDAVLKAVDEDFDLIRKALPTVRSVGSLTEMHRFNHGNENKMLMVFAKEQGYRSFKGNNWILKVAQNSEVAFAPVAMLSRQVFIFLFCISLLGIVAILSVLLFTVVLPIRKLNRATSLLGQGELETRVTIESSDEIGKLGQSFNEMAANLKEAREQLAHAAETALARANLAERKIIKISEETQQQIGRELHDDLGQQLTGISFMAEVLRQHLKSQNHPDEATASKINELIKEAISKTNKLSHGLYPVEMKETELRAMLMHLASNTESIYRTECEFVCEGTPKINTPLTNANLFRIVQEAVHNAVKHSAASKITIGLYTTADTMTIEVTDNGCGIGNKAELEIKGGLGMHTMQYRASIINAALDIASLPSGGTRVAIRLSATSLAI